MDVLEPRIQGLLQAVAVATVAVEEEASTQTLRTAARSVHRELRKVANSDDLWVELYRRSLHAGVPPQAPPAIIQVIGDIFSEEMASLLAQAGWRYPPEPSAGIMVSQTREAIEKAATGSKSVTAEIESVRSQLGRFVDELRAHLPAADPSGLRRLLHRGRKTAMVSGWLIALLGQTSFGIATGPEPDFNVEFTTGEGVKIEVVVPPPWHEDEKALSGLFAAGLIENLSMTLEDSRESADGEADQEIWRTVELLASQATDLANRAKDLANQAKNGQDARPDQKPGDRPNSATRTAPTSRLPKKAEEQT
jgi:hypothetical protein